MQRVFILLISFALTAHLLQAQTPDTVSTTDGFIKVETKVSSTKIPQNVEFTYSVIIRWSGDLDRYEIEELQTPSLTNLEVVGNASSNQVGASGNRKMATKIFEFKLKPLEMGMAYIDGLRIRYKDTKTDEEHFLTTNRLQVEIIDPVFDDGQYTLTLVFGAVLSLVVIALVLALMLRRKKMRSEQSKVPVEFTLIEDKYLGELKERVDLEGPRTVESFSILSKLFKRYLSERYQIATAGLSNTEITDELNRQAVSEKLLQSVSEILTTADVAKFSGKVQDGDLERVYTLIENILNKNKADFIEDTNVIGNGHG